MNLELIDKEIAEATESLKLAQEQLKEAQDKIAKLKNIRKMNIKDFVFHIPVEKWNMECLDICVLNNIEIATDKLDKFDGIRRIKSYDLSLHVKQHTFTVGDVLAIPYYCKGKKLVPFIIYKVENDKIFLHSLVTIDDLTFGKTNDYENSFVRRKLTELIDCFEPSIAIHFCEHEVEFVDKDDSCRMVKDKFWLLDHGEVYTYFKTAKSRLRYFGSCSYSGSCSYPWWLRSLNTIFDDNVSCITCNGNVSNDYVTNFNGVCVACAIR